MLSSKSLSERNSDPLLTMCHCGANVADHKLSDNHSPVEVRRLEFQHGKLPANPILVGVRHPSEHWREWLAALNDSNEAFSCDDGNGSYRTCTEAQIKHARRVLHLVAALAT